MSEDNLQNIEVGLSVYSNDDSYKKAMDVAKALSKSDMVPQTYRDKPENCIIALDVARHVGSSPLIVMQNLNIIKGKPSWSSTYISGVVNAKYKKVTCRLSGEGDARGCQVIAYDEDGSVLAEGVRVTVAMAKAEKWWSKKDQYGKESSKWQTMPDLMLQYRAYAFFGRVHCPDRLWGLQSEHEVIDTHQDHETPRKIDPLAKTARKEEDIVKTDKDVAEDAAIIEPGSHVKHDIPKKQAKTQEKKESALEAKYEGVCSLCGTEDISKEQAMASFQSCGQEICKQCEAFNK